MDGTVSFVEQIQLPLLGPHILVADTMVFYDDIVRRLRHNQSRTALVESVQRRTTRLFAASHVYEEMYGHIRGFRRRSVERDDVLRVFERTYLPICRFVDTLGGDPHPRVVPVAEVDTTDVPTAELAMLLAPCDVLTRDSHLLAAGFGTSRWLPRIFEAEELLGVDGAVLMMAWLMGDAGKRLGVAVHEVTDAVGGLLRSSEPARLLAAGVAGALVAAVAMLGPEVIAGSVRQVATGLGKAGIVGAQIATEPVRRRSALQASSVQPEHAVSTVERIARLVAADPLDVTRIARRLLLDSATLSQVLEHHPSFVEVDGLWGVGCARSPQPRMLGS